jgi:hypothetical protein
MMRSIATIGRLTLQVRRLAMDIFRQFPGDTVRILAAASGSLGCQVVALLGLYAYLKALAQNEALLSYPARESPLLFGIVATTTLLLFIGFTLLEYRANMAILRVTRRYQHLGAREALSVSSQLPHWFAAENEPHISMRHLRQIISVDVHHRSRLARLFLLGIIPAARLVLCALALFYLNAQFTVLILFAVGIPVAGLYSVGRRVADSITTRETGSPPAFVMQRDLLDKSWEEGTPLLPGAIEWDTSLGQADSRHRQYFRRLQARTYGAFLINIANTVGIMVLVLALGFWTLLAGKGDWSLWLTYLIVLRYFLASLRATAQSVVRATRYLRQSQRFTAFLAAATAAANSPYPETAPCPESIARAFKGDESAQVGDDELDDD